MRVSVVICEHTLDRYQDVREATESVLTQSHDDVEVVLVSDGNEAVCERFRAEYGDQERVLVHCNGENAGLVTGRNRGAELATGDVVAFLDDDAIADEHWVERLVDVYETKDVPAVGGRMTPKWVAGKPHFLPEEFYWLVGVTHRGFADGPGEVRNTFGSNISFDREIFLELGGFEVDIGGRKGDANLQAEEPEFCTRLKERYGYGVYYNPDAKVAHKVFDYRTELPWLLDRAFWQGYSKRGMEVLVPESTGTESEFLGTLLRDAVPDRIEKLVQRPSLTKLIQLVMLFVFTACVGAGYLYGAIKWRQYE